ncbi:MAG: DUF2064 domain-containing protein [Ilumatobacteraceae bacterium]
MTNRVDEHRRLPLPAVHLTVIARAPVAGRVKTRLSPACTPVEAAEVAAAALDDTLDAVDAAFAASLEGSVRRVLLFDGPPGRFMRSGYELAAQRGDGLDERLANGFADLGPGLIIAMDAPSGGRWLNDAIRALRAGYDCIGLTTDGGYWLIGLVDPDPNAIIGVPMSQSNSGLAQLSRLHAGGRPVRMLPMIRDLDTFDDLRAACDDRGRLGTTARRLLATR